jgi:hypothetical protein
MWVDQGIEGETLLLNNNNNNYNDVVALIELARSVYLASSNDALLMLGHVNLHQRRVIRTEGIATSIVV